MNQARLIISTDVVLFSICAERLAVLLVSSEDGRWRLPGGPVAMDEDLDASALRHLVGQTGLRNVYLEQLYTFGHPQRDAQQRAVAVTYYALVPMPPPVPFTPPAVAPAWFPVGDLPALLLDHADIVALAHRRLAAKLAYSTIALQFMPAQFTLSTLQTVYETILGTPLDKRNFRKRMLALGCLEATGERVRPGNHRPARLYRARLPGTVEFIK